LTSGQTSQDCVRLSSDRQWWWRRVNQSRISYVNCSRDAQNSALKLNQHDVLTQNKTTIKFLW